eukprot:353762-Chlamydomonas_euryale.AAC.2
MPSPSPIATSAAAAAGSVARVRKAPTPPAPRPPALWPPAPRLRARRRAAHPRAVPAAAAALGTLAAGATRLAAEGRLRIALPPLHSACLRLAFGWPAVAAAFGWPAVAAAFGWPVPPAACTACACAFPPAAQAATRERMRLPPWPPLRRLLRPSRLAARRRPAPAAGDAASAAAVGLADDAPARVRTPPPIAPSTLLARRLGSPTPAWSPA